MASVFRRKYTKVVNDRKVKKQSQCWYIKYRDADGIERRVKGYKDKTATQQLAAKLEREAELARARVVDRYKEHRKKPLAAHAEEFKVSLVNKGTTTKQAKQVYNRTMAVLRACKCTFITDVSVSKIQGYLAERRTEGPSVRSSNFYLQAIKQFSRWLVADGRTAENPIAYLKGQNPQLDIRHERRSLTLEEIRKLLEAAANGDTYQSMTGPERYMLYVLALTTGFRAAELASLTWYGLDLSHAEPTITIRAAYTKNRQETTLPLRQDVAAIFREWQSDNN